MASKTAGVGSKGNIQIVITQLSQDIDDNRSHVRVQGYVWLDSGSSSDSTGNCKAKITGTNSSSTVTVNGSYSSSKRKVIEDDWWVTHDSNGNKTVSYKFSFGPTITSNLGDGGSVSLSMTLTRIAQVPDAPPAPAMTIVGGGSVGLTWTAPNDNGGTIAEYGVEYANNPDFTGSTEVSAGTTPNKTISGLAVSTMWYFRVRARNARGWGAYGETGAISLSDPPGDMAAPTFSYIPPDVVQVAFTPPEIDGGSPVTGYELEYSTSSAFTTSKTATATSSPINVTDMLFGTIYYFRVRASNMNGAGPWSPTAQTSSTSGPRVKRYSIWRRAICYIKVAGVWRMAVPYVKKDGVWKVVGG